MKFGFWDLFAIDPEFLAFKQSLLEKPHIAPITSLPLSTESNETKSTPLIDFLRAKKLRKQNKVLTSSAADPSRNKSKEQKKKRSDRGRKRGKGKLAGKEEPSENSMKRSNVQHENETSVKPPGKGAGHSESKKNEANGSKVPSKALSKREKARANKEREKSTASPTQILSQPSHARSVPGDESSKSRQEKLVLQSQKPSGSSRSRRSRSATTAAKAQVTETQGDEQGQAKARKGPAESIGPPSIESSGVNDFQNPGRPSNLGNARRGGGAPPLLAGGLDEVSRPPTGPKFRGGRRGGRGGRGGRRDPETVPSGGTAAPNIAPPSE